MIARRTKRTFKRTARKRPVRKIFRPMAQKGIHFFKRTFILPTGPYSVSDSISLAGLNFQLASLPNYTEFTNLFDQYRINGVRVKIIFTKNESTTNTSVTTNLIPIMGTCIDYDNASAPINVNEVLQYETARVHRMDKPIVRFLRPKVDQALYSGAFTSYGNMRTWIDSDSPTVQHYGLKWYTDGTGGGSVLGTTVIGYFTVYVTMYIACKNVV